MSNIRTENRNDIQYIYYLANFGNTKQFAVIALDGFNTMEGVNTMTCDNYGKVMSYEDFFSFSSMTRKNNTITLHYPDRKDGGSYLSYIHLRRTYPKIDDLTRGIDYDSVDTKEAIYSQYIKNIGKIVCIESTIAFNDLDARINELTLNNNALTETIEMMLKTIETLQKTINKTR